MPLPLGDEITLYFSSHAEHQVKNLFITAEGIFRAKTTNLNEVKDELGNILENQDTTKPESNYKRLIRFFQMSDEEKQELSKSVLCCMLLFIRVKR